MAQVCARCEGSTGDDARFCPSCGSPLSGLEGAERKLATIVFADLVGSTEMASSLDPEELRRRLAPFFEVARSALEEHGGTVEKYIGDAVMAVFGVPQAHGDDPDRAVAAALDLSRRVESIDRELSVRVGVETGEVLAARRGTDLSVTGEAVNAAARLQQGAQPGLLPSFFLGEWDSALEMAEAVREAWAAADRPPIAALAAALACAGAILGYRGEEEASADWFRFAASVAPGSGGQSSGVAMLEADVHLHRGQVAEAVALTDDVPSHNMWWRSAYAATRAEVVALAGDARADELVREAAGWVGDHRYARGILLRAEGARHGDEELLRQSLGVFEGMECAYQAARTGWLLGGPERAEAERALAGLGATPPAG